LEEIIGVGPLWDRSQDSERWKLLTKNNFGHSTLTINAEQHAVKARALVSSAKMEGKPQKKAKPSPFLVPERLNLKSKP
jgi:hypothetical protein